LFLSLFIFGLALAGHFYPYNRGTLYTALISLYALTSGIAGYVAASYYRQMEGQLWVRNILATCFVFCGPLWGVFALNNTVAIAYRVRVGVWVGGEGVRWRVCVERRSDCGPTSALDDCVHYALWLVGW
jgi:hypothetical protein